jgi:hypothetical protein
MMMMMMMMVVVVLATMVRVLLHPTFPYKNIRIDN